MNGAPVEFTCLGTPVPQGSKRYVGNGRMVESSPHLKDWRADLVHAARQVMDARVPLEGPIRVQLDFAVKRPTSAAKNVRHPVKRPDIDKTSRAVLDALVIAGVMHDDSQVVQLRADKRFAGSPGALALPGVYVHVAPLEAQ